jgi:hypothetical protein
VVTFTGQSLNGGHQTVKFWSTSVPDSRDPICSCSLSCSFVAKSPPPCDLGDLRENPPSLSILSCRPIHHSFPGQSGSVQRFSAQPRLVLRVRFRRVTPNVTGKKYKIPNVYRVCYDVTGPEGGETPPPPPGSGNQAMIPMTGLPSELVSGRW